MRSMLPLAHYMTGVKRMTNLKKRRGKTICYDFGEGTYRAAEIKQPRFKRSRNPLNRGCYEFFLDGVAENQTNGDNDAQKTNNRRNFVLKHDSHLPLFHLELKIAAWIFVDSHSYLEATRRTLPK
jgi:hypothetical protein